MSKVIPIHRQIEDLREEVEVLRLAHARHRPERSGVVHRVDILIVQEEEVSMIEELIASLTEYVQAAKANAESGPEDKAAAQAREEVASKRFQESLQDAIGAFGVFMEQYGEQFRTQIEKALAEIGKGKGQ